VKAEVQPGSEEEKMQAFACLLLKKYFLDDRSEEKDLE
jgi:hypothetical protein